MKIYFMGICGTAMGNAALLARAAGHEVLGSDLEVYPPMSTVLANAGIAIHLGYDPVRLESLAPDLVVIGNAMSRGHPEIEWLLDTRALPFTSLPALLHESVLRHRRNIVVAGTHGKTTTTALTAFLLRENGRDPGYLIGGVPQDPPEGSHLGALDAPFVIEGDEYDSAFFDKRSKFIHYAPHIAVLNNLEFDHADIFRDLADVQRTFRHFTRIVPRNGFVVMNGDDANLRALGALPWTRVVRVGLGQENDLRITGFAEGATGATFELEWRGEPWAKISWALSGIYNARNAAMAACAAGLALKSVLPGAKPAVHGTVATQPGLAAIDPRGINLDVLTRFRGVKRRQEVRVSTASVTVIEDFGHHPTALAETLISLRARFSGARLVAAFEPRSNTARTRVMQAGFARALSQADEVYLGAVSRAEKLADDERFDAEDVAQHLDSQGVHAQWFQTNEALLERLVQDTLPPEGPPRVVVFFSNGSFGGIIDRYAAAVKA
jgi:UDP-N-acetylmuramate: L-alanyl-gamma-D-glutamyl-meso-diaminopimelate ligase